MKLLEPSSGNYTPSVEETVLRLRRNMLIHSFLYYWKDAPIISDELWQKMADDLEALQKEYGWEWGFYDEHFKDWTGATGAHLPNDEWVVNKADQIKRLTEGSQ